MLFGGAQANDQALGDLAVGRTARSVWT
jgi:hypothetical protein